MLLCKSRCCYSNSVCCYVSLDAVIGVPDAIMQVSMLFAIMQVPSGLG